MEQAAEEALRLHSTTCFGITALGRARIVQRRPGVEESPIAQAHTSAL